MKNKILLLATLLSCSSVALAGTLATPVPEPSLLSLLAVGAVALIVNKLRKK